MYDVQWKVMVLFQGDHLHFFIFAKVELALAKASLINLKLSRNNYVVDPLGLFRGSNTWVAGRKKAWANWKYFLIG